MQPVRLHQLRNHRQPAHHKDRFGTHPGLRHRGYGAGRWSREARRHRVQRSDEGHEGRHAHRESHYGCREEHYGRPPCEDLRERSARHKAVCAGHSCQLRHERIRYPCYQQARTGQDASPHGVRWLRHAGGCYGHQSLGYRRRQGIALVDGAYRWHQRRQHRPDEPEVQPRQPRRQLAAQHCCHLQLVQRAAHDEERRAEAHLVSHHT